MEHPIDKRIVLFKFLYFTIILILVFDLLLSFYAYCTAIQALGEIPKGEDYFWSIVKQRGKTVHLPNYELSWFMIYCTLLTIIAFPLIVFINYVVSREFPRIHFNKKVAWLTLIVVIVYLLLNRFSESFGWYGGFILD
jgi:hypothetical protein